jgi:hypothetical protein
MQPEIHIGTSRTWCVGRHGTDVWPTLCGIHVSWVELARRQEAFTQSKQPTCMGCILIKFQHDAEEQDG